MGISHRLQLLTNWSTMDLFYGCIPSSVVPPQGPASTSAPACALLSKGSQLLPAGCSSVIFPWRSQPPLDSHLLWCSGENLWVDIRIVLWLKQKRFLWAEVNKELIPASQGQAGVQPSTGKQDSIVPNTSLGRQNHHSRDPPLSPSSSRFVYWAWLHRVWDTPWVSWHHLSWLCPLPAPCTSPASLLGWNGERSSGDVGSVWQEHPCVVNPVSKSKTWSNTSYYGENELYSRKKQCTSLLGYLCLTISTFSCKTIL